MRPTKRNLSNRLEALGAGDDEYPEADLITLLSAAYNDDLETVDPSADLVRCYGDVYRVSPDARELLARRAGGSR